MLPWHSEPVKDIYIITSPLTGEGEGEGETFQFYLIFLLLAFNF